MDNLSKAGERFQQLIGILDTLRGEGGCPWDREQDEISIVNYFLEEVYEAADAVINEDNQALKEELGDVLMEIVFLSQIFKEKKIFTIEEVVAGINQKMVSRHPHVFGLEIIENSEKIIENWNRQKDIEKDRSSALEGIPGILPALLEAFQIGQKVSLRGFDWEKASEVLVKVKEEIAELEEAVTLGRREKIFGEIGDTFFALVNLSRHLAVNPELALRHANEKFKKRYAIIEEKLRGQKREGGPVSPEELDRLWNEAKREEL